MKQLIFLISVVTLVSILVSCSKNDEEDLFKTAKEDLQNQNLEGAKNNLEKLVNKNPYSEFAPEAFFILGQIYQSMEADSIHRIEYNKIAIDYYNQLINNFPNHEKAPEALFMVAFINAEIFKDYNTAGLNYRKFLKMYPTHELAESARLELEFLGKSPEEILKLHGIGDESKASKLKSMKTKTTNK